MRAGREGVPPACVRCFGAAFASLPAGLGRPLMPESDRHGNIAVRQRFAKIERSAPVTDEPAAEGQLLRPIVTGLRRRSLICHGFGSSDTRLRG